MILEWSEEDWSRGTGRTSRTRPSHGERFAPRCLLGLIVCLLASCGAEGPILTPTPFKPDSGTVWIRCGTLIDGLSPEPSHQVSVLIENGKISSVGSATAPPAGVPALDLSAMTCLPGLIDMHTHLTDSAGDTARLAEFYSRSDSRQAEISRRNARATLLAGFTTVRNVGAYIAWSDLEIRDAVNRGEAVGPRIQAAGFYLTIPGGGGDLLVPGFAEKDIPARVRMGVAKGADAFRDKARMAVEGGADVLKVIASGAVLAYGGQPGQPEMTPEEIEAVVSVAHAAGKKVAAHAHGAQSIRDAILAGVDTIEHASLIDDEGIALARERGVALSMDIYNADYIDTEGRRQKWPEEFLAKNLELAEVQRANFTKAWVAGVPMVFGTDSAVYPHGDNAKQFRVMVERGMNPMDAIRSATSVAAQYLGWQDRVGAVVPGRFGDLIAVRGNPLDDIRTLETVAVVVKGGLPFKIPDD